MLEKVKSGLRKNRVLHNIRYFISAYKAPIGIIIKNHKNLKKFRRKYSNQRCFVIGNGPSLKAEDLEAIKEEYSFAANRIYEVFDKTRWRPTFYCVQDENILRESSKDIIGRTVNDLPNVFIRLHSYSIVKNMGVDVSKINFVPIFQKRFKGEGKKFREKADSYVYDGDTVTFFSIELAAYMGFKEIYLLGVDHNFPYIWTSNGLEVNDLNLASHFYDSADNNVGKDAHLRRSINVDAVNRAYESAEMYSKKTNKIKIFNATRGGKLDVFERIDFNQIKKNNG